MPNLSSYSIATANAEMQALLHGTTLNQITSLSAMHNRAARQILADIDPQETKCNALVGPIFNGVFDYSGITDLKGNKIIDVHPQVNRNLTDIFLQRFSQQFDTQKEYVSQPNFNINYDTATRTIRIDAPYIVNGVLLSEADLITGNGTWTVGGTASNLREDSINFADGSSSIEFDLAAGANPSVGYIRNTTLSALDLTNNLNQATQFLFSYLPTATDFSSVYMRFGSSTTDYWEMTVTQTFENNSFNNGWNLLGSLWPTTKTGNPDVTNITYIEVGFTYNGTAQTGVHVNGIYSRMGLLMDILYYSKYLFRDVSTGVFKETTTDDSDLINLDTDSYNLYIYQLLMQAIRQQNGANAEREITDYAAQYLAGVTKYKAMYKSEVQKTQTNYYYQRNPGYTRYLGRRY